MAHILIVEDTSQLRELLVFVLSGYGHRVDAAANGRAALEQLRAEEPDLVITDIAMPEMDGLELIRAASEEFPDLPFIAMSGGLTSSEAYLRTAAERGAKACLAKPFPMVELQDAITRVLLEHDLARVPVPARAI